MRLLTTDEVLEKLHWSRCTLDRAIKAGRFPAPAKVARSVRFDADEVEMALADAFAQRAQTPDQQAAA